MTTLFIDRRDAEICVKANTLRIAGADGSVQSAPLALLDRVVLHGPARITTGAIAALAARGTGLLILGGRHSGAGGALLGPAHADATIRLGQFAMVLSAEARRGVAAVVVRRKLLAQARFLRHALAIRPDRIRSITHARNCLNDSLARLRAAPLPLAVLHGLEGAAAAAYFDAYASILPPSAGFAGRNRRPPRDPVNAALSLAYTIGTFEAAREAQLAGLDVALGFLHAPAPGRESLACDLVEPLRPGLDCLVWRLFADQTLRPTHFTRDGDACLMGKAGRLAFYAAWELKVAPLRRGLRRGLRPLVAACRQAAMRDVPHA